MGLSALLLSATTKTCNKVASDQFCYRERPLFLPVIAESGTVFYFEKYELYGIEIPNKNYIAKQPSVYGIVCNLPEALRSAGKKVIVSGTLRYFNSDEAILSSNELSHLYFFEINKITVAR